MLLFEHEVVDFGNEVPGLGHFACSVIRRMGVGHFGRGLCEIIRRHNGASEKKKKENNRSWIGKSAGGIGPMPNFPGKNGMDEVQVGPIPILLIDKIGFAV